MNVKDSPLYKSLCKSVRKQDHKELLRMLEMVPESATDTWGGETETQLLNAFAWVRTPQGYDYWHELSDRIKAAGFDNW